MTEVCSGKLPQITIAITITNYYYYYYCYYCYYSYYYYDYDYDYDYDYVTLRSAPRANRNGSATRCNDAFNHDSHNPARCV